MDSLNSGVQVCIEGTSVCSLTDASGEFVLVIPADGDVVLTFTASDYMGRLVLAALPSGAVVTVNDIACDISTRECTPRQTEIEAP